MFIVKDKETGLYYKKGNIRSWWGAELVERKNATIYRSKGAIKISLGKMVSDRPDGKMIPNSGCCHYILDTDKWEIEEINF